MGHHTAFAWFMRNTTHIFTFMSSSIFVSFYRCKTEMQRGLKGEKNPNLLFLHIFRIIAFHTYEIVTGPWKWSPLVTSGKRLSTLMAFDLSSPNSAETCQTSVKLPGQHRSDTECQEHEGPASMGLSFTQEVLEHPQFGCQADWKSMSRPSWSSFSMKYMNERFGVPKAGRPSFHGEDRRSHCFSAFCHTNYLCKSVGSLLSATNRANPVFPLLVIGNL